MVVWNYNWQMAKVSKSWKTYVLAIPTIITSDIWTPTVEDIMTNNKFVFNWHKNLPSSFSWTKFNVNGWNTKIIVNSNKLVVFSWSTLSSLDSKTDHTARLKLIKNLI